MKVLVLTSTFPRWKNDSVPPFVYELSKRLAKSFEVFVLAPFSAGSKRYEELDGMKVYRFNYWPFKNRLADGAILPNLKKNPLFWVQVPFLFLSELFAIIRVVRKHRIRILHAHWVIPQGLIAVIYMKMFNRKIKILCTAHGSDIFGLKRLTHLKKWVISNCSMVTCVSNAIKEQILNFGCRTELRVLPMGVDSNKFNPLKYSKTLKKKYNHDGNLLLYVGRLSKKKGLEYLISAMPEIIKAFPKTRLLIVGDGEEKEKLIALTQKRKMNNYVTFVGAISNDELPKYYATADIFVSPSLSEGLPVTFMEAMSSGCILVATNLPGNKDIIKDGETGFLVKQKSSEEIAKKVILLLKQKENLNKIRKQARAFIQKNFDWKIIAQRYEEILRSKSGE